MDRSENYSRRQILLLSAIPLVGCQTDQQSDGGAGTTDKNVTRQTPTQTATDTPEPTPDRTETPTPTPETSTPTRTETTPQHPENYIVDLKDPQGNNIGNTNTDREWDDHVFDEEELREYKSKWIDEAAYDTVMDEIQEENKEKYIGVNAGGTYSNSKYLLGDVEENNGYWDPEFYSDLDQLEHIIRDPQNVVRTHQRIVHPTGYSAWNWRFAATLEKIINTHNQNAKNYEGERKAFHASDVNENQHGTVITYTDLENTDIEGEHPWQFVDTTSNTEAPVTEDINTRGVFNPFVDSYKPESQTKLGYESEKERAIGALQSFIVPEKYPENFEYQELAISDILLEHIFNDHIPDKGDINPVLDMIEKGTYLHMESDHEVIVYGENLDDYKMVSGDRKLYRMCLREGVRITEEVVDDYLEEY